MELGEEAILESNRYQQIEHPSQLKLQELMNQVDLGEEAILESNRYQQIEHLAS